MDHDILTKEQEVELGLAIQKSLQLQQELLVHVDAKKEEMTLRAVEQQQSEDEWFSLMGEGNSKPFKNDDEDFDDHELASLSIMESSSWYQQQSASSFNLADLPRLQSWSLEEKSESKFFLQDNELDLLSEKELKDAVGLSRIKVQSILLEGAVARDTMIRSNVKLVVDIAKRWCMLKSRGTNASWKEVYQGSWDRPSLDEVIQEGLAGLMQAVERYDPQRNIKFSTFATSYITNKVRICFQINSTSIQVPPIYHLLRQQATTLMRKYHTAGEPGPSWDKLALEIGVSPQRLDNAMRLTQAALSMDAPLYRSKGMSAGKGGDVQEADYVLADMLVDNEVAEDSVELSFLRQTLESAMANELAPTERDVLRLRLGLDDGVSRSLREVSEEFGGMMNLRQVQTTEKVALSKLRSPNSLATYKFLAYLDFAGIDSSTAKLD